MGQKVNLLVRNQILTIKRKAMNAKWSFQVETNIRQQYVSKIFALAKDSSMPMPTVYRINMPQLQAEICDIRRKMFAQVDRSLLSQVLFHIDQSIRCRAKLSFHLLHGQYFSALAVDCQLWLLDCDGSQKKVCVDKIGIKK